MLEDPRRDQLSPYWQAAFDDLEASVDQLSGHLERSKQARKTLRERRRLEQAKNAVLRDRVKRLEDQVRSLGGIPHD